MAQNQQLSVFGQVAPATTGTAGQVLVSAGSSASSYWASAIPVSAYSAQFNGSSQYFSVGTTSNFKYLHDATSDWTVECWVYPTTLNAATSQFIIATDAETAFIGIFIGLSNITNGDITIATFKGTSGSLTGYNTATNTVIVNTWQHIAVTFTASTKAYTVYVNGVSKSLSLSTGATASGSFAYSTANHTYPLNIGRYVTGSASGAYFPGYISNLRIVKSVVYTGEFTPPTSPLGTSQAAGTNISDVTASQTSLLTCNGPGFTDSSPNTFTISNIGNVVTSQFAPFSSFSAISRSATQTQTILTSGSGTYYTPSGVAWLRIRMVGGGGGAGGGGTGGANYGGAGSAGTNTVFGSSLLVATSGGGADNSNGAGLAGGAGGTGTIGTGATGIVIAGGRGSPGAFVSYATGGTGGATPFGGAGVGYPPGSASAGTAGSTNSGSGGGGSGAPYASISFAGHGGGAGGYVEAYISSPAASYAYTIGTGGGGGAGGTYGAGGSGGSGVIIVEENYAVSVTTSNYTAQYLIVAGGGGGGYGGGGGGGAGGALTGTSTLNPGSIYSITVGAGGAGGTSSVIDGTNGTNSSFNSVSPIGGGGGGSNSRGGKTGGSGGGSAKDSNAAGASGTSGQGYAGGSVFGTYGYGAAGGGGASAAGGAGGPGEATGDGGAGLASSITGSSVYYAGGGGGSSNGASGAGGAGGGGAGGTGGVGSAGTVNTGGGGGGGAWYTYAGGAGGSGVVILVIPNFNYTGITTGTVSVTTSGSNKILTFTASGSYTA